MSVAGAQRQVSSREFAEWLAFWRIEPNSEDRADLRMAMICATLANCNRGKGAPVFKPADFMPDWEPREGQSVMEMQARLKAALAGAQKGKAKNGNARPRSR